MWSVSLSNGETLYEEKDKYVSIKGELSPWQKLLAYIEKNSLKITSLSLYMKDGRRFNLRSAGKNPKFHAFTVAPQPVSYKMFRKAGGDMMGDKIMNQDLYTVAEATYDNGSVIQLWVDEATGNSWSVLV
jgi:hypothetical protein|tara:strand:+ start:1812 stop:2201 length:390 start_codon:yes stop_codon:yes gene_type:complete